MTIDGVQQTQEPGFFAKAGTACKDAALWLGRVIKNGFWNYLVPAVKAVWEFLKTPFGWSVMAFAAGVTLLSVAAAQSKETKTLACRVSCYAAAALCFIGAGAALAIGIMGAAAEKAPVQV